MDKTDLGTVAAGVVSGIAMEQIAGVLGVVLMGAAWGALFAVLKAPPMTRRAIASFMFVRALPAMALSWVLSLVLNGALAEVHSQVEQTALFLAVSFFVASPKETTELMREVLISIWQLRRVFVRVKE